MQERTTMFICFLITFFPIFLDLGNSQVLYDQEQAILIRLKTYWQNPPSLSHWTSSNSSHCSWPEVTCTNDSISELQFRNLSITGSIPSFICDLKNLTLLDLYYNNIMGMFPSGLFNCSKLEYLDLSQNYFVGTIPDDIDRMARLSYLDLSGNNFSGSIPAAIGRLGELKALKLYYNLFNGTFPSEIGNLTKLEVLYMANNEFLPSALPENFTRLKNLNDLWFSEANLIGEIPEMIGDMAALEKLDLSTNQLTGNIPKSLFMLKELQVLFLYKNNLSGEIPQVIEALNLTELDLSDNNLRGTIPEDIGKLSNLSLLCLFFNQLSGAIPESIGRIPALTDVRLFTNNLSGELPQDFGLYSELKSFQVATNKLTGRLPEYVCSAGKLVGLVAFDNNLEGELPESLRNCSSLEVLRISNNALSGNIPPTIWTIPNLQQLMISNNFFTGELPSEISSNLSRVEISNNNFSGSIPVGIGSWSNLVVFYASNNLFTGSIPQELTALPLLSDLLLNQNQLTGTLPSEIISWKSLTTLDLRDNMLSGQVPEEFLSLPKLLDLDLSNNQFSGKVPTPTGFLKLTSLNLSSNSLSGEIPSEFQNAAYSSSFLNNSGLCASTSSSSLLDVSSCDSKPEKSSKISTQLLVLIICALFLAFVIILSLTLFVIKFHRTRLCENRSTYKLTSFQRLKFTELDILPKLTERNVIGSGGSGEVYKVELNHSSGDFVAVKRMWNCTEFDQKLEKEFEAEVQILGGIRHLNIVKLLCCIITNQAKFLVYEYVKNNSLDRWLHYKKSSSGSPSWVRPFVLDWPKRFHIALGAAQGLSYMHNDCSPPVIHRDVKSSNILLDSEFNAKIADFGLARILTNQGDLATESAVAGSFGYMAPEFAQTRRVNEKIDVYSFGVVLLELTTGKEATIGDENTCLAEWAWHHHFLEGKPIDDALDEEIKETRYLDEMCSLFKLGIVCTSTLPSMRPCMREVLQNLLQCSDQHLSRNNGVRKVYNCLLPNDSESCSPSSSESDISSLVSHIV